MKNTALSILSVCCLLAACAEAPVYVEAPQTNVPQEIAQGIEQIRQSNAYILQPGDLLEIKVFMEEEMDRTQRISGSVGVLISIDSEGAPTNVTITHSSGYPELDDTARRWILRHWRFHPATRSGIPHPSQVRTSVRFVLH